VEVDPVVLLLAEVELEEVDPLVVSAMPPTPASPAPFGCSSPLLPHPSAWSATPTMQEASPAQSRNREVNRSMSSSAQRHPSFHHQVRAVSHAFTRRLDRPEE
jgi:hypothetical protein